MNENTGWCDADSDGDGYPEGEYPGDGSPTMQDRHTHGWGDCSPDWNRGLAHWPDLAAGDALVSYRRGCSP